MRSWDKYCEDTEKAFVHFIDCIDHPVYIRGYLGTKHSYLFQVNYSLHPYWDNWVTVEVLYKLSEICKCPIIISNENVTPYNPYGALIYDGYIE